MRELRRDEELTGDRPAGEAMPDELGATKLLLQDFIKRLQVIKNEQELLKEDRQVLIDEFSDRIDMKTLQAAMRTVEIRKSVQHRDTFDTYLEAIDPTPGS